MKAKNLIAFLLVIVIIAALSCVAVFDIKIGKFRVPSTFDKERGIRQGLDLVGGSVIVFEPDVKDLSAVTSADMDAAEAVIRKRLDDQNFSEATLSRQGETSIRVEIPGVDDPQAAVATIGATAKLEFLDADGNLIMDARGNVKKATAMYGPTEEYGNSVHYVQLTFTSEGRKKFAEATANAINADNVAPAEAVVTEEATEAAETTEATETAEDAANVEAVLPSGPRNIIAIALDGVVQMAPSVNEVIDSDTCIMTGGYTQEEAKRVADLITSGQLPFSLKDAEVRSIGPTLGEKALSTSLKAALFGILLVMLFMIIIYRLPGLVASISLIAYVAIVTLIMAGFYIPSWRFVILTLPGIAGVILSIGMAVDANVVIFERIKDELRLGKSVGAAVNGGFKRALTAIIDSNITTVIASVVLYYFGTGTVKSFAVTLFIGIVISMLTAVTLTKFLLRRMVNLGIKNPAFYGVSKRRAEK